LTESNFRMDDFATLEAYELKKRVRPVVEQLEGLFEDIDLIAKPVNLE
jgi:hypothetical protein